MKRSITFFRRFLFTVLLLQFLNISFNCVNFYNAGQSGFRHKISFNFFESDAVAEIMHDTSGEPEQNENNEPHEKIFLENFELGLFVSLVEITSVPECGTLKKRFAVTTNYQNHVSDLNPRPPKTA
jgi:hypothetical protein